GRGVQPEVGDGQHRADLGGLGGRDARVAARVRDLARDVVGEPPVGLAAVVGAEDALHLRDRCGERLRVGRQPGGLRPLGWIGAAGLQRAHRLLGCLGAQQGLEHPAPLVAVGVHRFTVRGARPREHARRPPVRSGRTRVPRRARRRVRMGTMATPTLRARLADRGVSPRLVTMAVAALATFSLMLVTMLLPVPYAVQAPGPVIDTLGDVDGVELIHIEGTETYETSGALQLTTVTTAGGPGYPVDSGGVIRGWLSPTTTVAPVELFFDPGQSQDEIDQASAQQMISSQQNATVAALTELGYDVPAELTVVG